jgi:hypothetical protein
VSGCSEGSLLKAASKQLAQLLFLTSLISADQYAASRSEGSERDCVLKGNPRGNFLKEFILAYIAPVERFSFLAISTGLTLDAMSLRSSASSARVHRRPAGRGPVIRKSP